MYGIEQPVRSASENIVGVLNEVRIMKSTFAMSCLIAGTLLAPVAVIAQDSDTHRSDPEMFVKDSAITTQIKAKLATEHFSSLAKIHVDTDKNGVVWLSGTAESQAAIDRAVAVAKGTEHVKSVHSTLTVKKDD
jgi:hyperosmotically inducible periplasmic protein